MTGTAPDEVLTRLAGWQSPLREQFPIITADPGLAFLDSAATSQKPQAVLDAALHQLRTANANVGRGSYPWANAATATVERARQRVKDFLGDPDPEQSEVHFVSGTTEGLRRVALDWLPQLLGDGDEIAVPFADHQANLRPWQEAAAQLDRSGIRVAVRELPYDAASGDYDHRAFGDVFGERTRFVAATHVHHVYGGNMNVHRIRAAVGPDVPICLDAAQSVGHLPVSVADLDVDFVVFSGHKTLALPGTGVLWSRNRRGPRFRPAGWAGTPNVTGIVSLVAALDWLDTAGLPAVEEWTTALAGRLTDRLADDDQIDVLGCRSSLRGDSTVQHRNGIVTFRHRGIASDDLGFVFAAKGVMVRADTHCQGGRPVGDTAVRVSVHVYNTPAEIDRVLDTLSGLMRYG